MTVDKNDPTYCHDCMWHARRLVGIYSDGETLPRNLRRQVEEAYDTEYYLSHEKDNLPIRK